MATITVSEPKEKTREEKQAELDAEKKTAWNAFRKFKFDDLSPEDREFQARHLYETISTHLTPDAVGIPFDFWKDYEDTDEIKEVNRFRAHVKDTLSQVEKMKTPPTKESWLDRDRGIVPNMKREWKAKLEPFKSERVLREKLKVKAEQIFNQPEYKDKEIRIDMADEMTKALKNIEETVYKPVRANIEKIEAEIIKRVSKKK